MFKSLWLGLDFALLIAASALAAEPAPPKFTTKPTAAKVGDKVKVDFAVDRETDVSVFIEDLGFEAFPLDPSVDDKAREVLILQEEPDPKIKILGDFSHRHAVVAAGLGEFAASSMVVVPKFGPSAGVRDAGRC